MENKLSKKFYFAMILFSFIGQVAWVVENMYFNVYIYKIFNATPSDISLMVAMSAVAACVTTLLIGALSDKLGRRKAFMCYGYILWGISIMSFNLIPTLAGNSLRLGVSLVIIMDCVMTFFGSSANDACFNAWLTDSTDSTNRGKVEGLNSMMPLLAVLAVFGGFMGFDLQLIDSWNIIYIVIGTLAIICGIIGFFVIKDSTVTDDGDTNYFKNIFYGFRPSTIKNNKKLYILLGFFAIFNIAVQIFMPYLILFYEKTLNMDNYVIIMAPAIIIAAILTALYGKMYDKHGFSKTVWIPLYMMIIGACLLVLFNQTVIVFIASTFLLSGDLMGMGIFGAGIRDNTPIDKVGRFQGIRIFGQVLIPGVIGPSIGAAVLKNAPKVINSDGTESFIPNTMIFVCTVVVLIILVSMLYITLKLSDKKEKEKL